MTIEVLEPNFLKLKDKLLNGGDVQTIDDVMKAHDNFLDQCLKECLLTDHNLFRILTRLNQNNNFFARIIQRFFNQMQTFEVHERAVAENEYYDRHTKYMGGNKDDEEQKHGEGVD
jgi:gamma-tubulin complex component 2